MVCVLTSLALPMSGRHRTHPVVVCVRDSRSGYTAILHAAKHGHKDLVEVLLRHKVWSAVVYAR